MSYLQSALKISKQEQFDRPATNIRLVEKAAFPMTKGRRQTLELTMEAVIAKALDEIAEACNGRQLKSGESITQAEDDITLSYKEVLKGERNIQDYLNAVKSWKEISIAENQNK